MKKFISILFAALFFSSNAYSASILTQTEGTSGSWDLGGPLISNFMPIFNATHSYTTTARFDNLSELNMYDALWITDEVGTNGLLTAGEISAMTSYISAGHKAVAITDNQNWTNWNNSLETLLGASITDECASANGTPTVTNSLTNGVTTLFSSTCNSTINPTPNAQILFSNNMAALYTLGAGEVLLLSSVDILGNASNNPFNQNIVDWLDVPLQGVPETGTIFLLGMSLMLAGFTRRKTSI